MNPLGSDRDAPTPPEDLLGELADRYAGVDTPFLIAPEGSLRFDDLWHAPPLTGDAPQPGDVVALIGDFTPINIRALLELASRRVILLPLTEETRASHDAFFQAAGVDVVVEGGRARRMRAARLHHPLLETLRVRQHPGLILFSTGITGQPKAILHDFSRFLERYRRSRATLRTLSFLLFDHLAGIDILFRILFGRGTLVVPSGRTPERVMADLRQHNVELLPTTPSFLRLLLWSGELDQGIPPGLKIITYGAERMDPATLGALCDKLPGIALRQTYGMSELGVLKVEPMARESLWIKVGGAGVELRVEDGVLWVRSPDRMLGYLNADTPFDAEGWFNTGDCVETDGEALRVVGRVNEVINVGGLKVLPEEVENAACAHVGVLRAKCRGVANPVTGQYIELTCEPKPGVTLEREELRAFLSGQLPASKRPHRLRIGPVAMTHRFKQA